MSKACIVTYVSNGKSQGTFLMYAKYSRICFHRNLFKSIQNTKSTVLTVC